MNIFAWIVIIAGAVWSAVSDWLDRKVSKLKPWYGREEGNKRFRNADGSFDSGKAAIFGPLVTYGGAAAGYAFVWLMIRYAVEGTPTQNPHTAGLFTAGGLMLVIGTYRYFHAYKGNIKHFRDSRVKQIAWRATAKANIDDDLWWGGTNIERLVDDVFAPYWTPWINTVAANEIEARKLLRPMVREWLAIPETDLKKIWVDLKFHPKQ